MQLALYFVIMVAFDARWSYVNNQRNAYFILVQS